MLLFLFVALYESKTLFTVFFPSHSLWAVCTFSVCCYNKFKWNYLYLSWYVKRFMIIFPLFWLWLCCCHSSFPQSLSGRQLSSLHKSPAHIEQNMGKQQSHSGTISTSVTFLSTNLLNQVTSVCCAALFIVSVPPCRSASPFVPHPPPISVCQTTAGEYCPCVCVCVFSRKLWFPALCCANHISSGKF